MSISQKNFVLLKTKVAKATISMLTFTNMGFAKSLALLASRFEIDFEPISLMNV
jgi:hypothetical protein